MMLSPSDRSSSNLTVIPPDLRLDSVSVGDVLCSMSAPLGLVVVGTTSITKAGRAPEEVKP